MTIAILIAVYIVLVLLVCSMFKINKEDTE